MQESKSSPRRQSVCETDPYIFERLFQLDAYYESQVIRNREIFQSLESRQKQTLKTSQDLNNITNSVCGGCVGAGSGVRRRNP